jgi:hypothetical protein
MGASSVQPDQQHNPFTGPLVYLIDQNHELARAMTIREWNAHRAALGLPEPPQVKPQRCPRCGTTAMLSPSGVCVPCTAECGWDPPCDACKAEDAGGVEWATLHVDTCAPGQRMLRYIADAERNTNTNWTRLSTS